MSDFFVHEISTSRHAFNKDVSNTSIAAHQAEELVFRNNHDCTGFAGNHSGSTTLFGKYRHSAENLIFFHVADFFTVYPSFGVPFNNNEYMLSNVALIDQFFASGQALETCGGTNLRLL